MSTTQELAVKDESGTKILAVTSPQGSQSAGVILSSSKFVKGGKYTISIGDTVINEKVFVAGGLFISSAQMNEIAVCSICTYDY